MMTYTALPAWLNAAFLLVTAVVTFIYSWYVTSWLSKRIFPRVPRLPWVRVAWISTAVALPVCYLTGNPALYMVVAVFVPVLLLASYVDIRSLRIPNAYTIQVAFLALLTAVWVGWEHNKSGSHWGELLGAALGLLAVTTIALFGLHVFSRGFGMGDVKLGAALVLPLLVIVSAGWPASVVTAGVVTMLLALVVAAWLTLAFLAGTALVIVRLVSHGMKPLPVGAGLPGSTPDPAEGAAGSWRQQGVPFGPCLVGAWLVVVASAPLFTGLVGS